MSKKINDKTFIGVIDLGTTSIRFIVFTLSGEVISIKQKAITQQYPHYGWVEEKPEEILRVMEEMIRNTISENHKINENIKALGICNQRESVMFWDKLTGKPLSELIVWQDRRTSDRCEELIKSGLSSTVKDKTGLMIDPYFSATKIEWLLKNKPELLKHNKDKKVACGTLDSWIIFKLTNNHFTDVSNASRTMLFNINDLAWDADLLKVFGISENILPVVKPSFGNAVFGCTAKDSIFGRKIPVNCVMGDQQASLFGHKCFSDGQIKCTFGTGSFLLLNTGTKRISSTNNLITTIFYQSENNEAYYALEGSIYNTGSIFQWFKENLKIISEYSEIEKMATGHKYQSNMYLVPAFTGLGAPYWDSNAGALLIGFNRSTRVDEIVRIAEEAIAYRTNDVILAMEQDMGKLIREIKIDGGVSRENLFCQILSDLTGKKIIKSSLKETTSLGTFFGVGLGMGLWESVAEIKTNHSLFNYQPKINSQLRTALYKNWLNAVERSKNWLNNG